MPQLPSGKKIYEIDGDLVILGGLTRLTTLPEPWPTLLRKLHDGHSLGEMEWADAFFAEHEVLNPTTPTPGLFPLREVRAQGWTNSDFGREIIAAEEGPLTVLDALNWADIDALPRGGAFLYLGDGAGFYARQTCTGKIPCARCLVLRYLAGRGAARKLHSALKLGYRISLRAASTRPVLAAEEDLSLFGGAHKQDSIHLQKVLPLPECTACLSASLVRKLTVGLFSPVVKHVQVGHSHAAHLPEMLWLAGHDTVGGGGAHEEDEVLGRDKAIAEALERYSAHFTPAHATDEGIPFQSEEGSRVFSRQRALLTEPGSVSTGLACRDSLQDAIADGLAEVCERDALARFWLAVDALEVGVRLLEESVQDFRENSLTLRLYQLDSYHLPTVLCVGRSEQGHIATGSCCAPLARARRKALAECLQNAAYFRAYSRQPPDPPRTFEDHAGLYWNGALAFPDLPLRDEVEVRPLPAPVFHADLTPPDLALLGIHAVRVQVPGLLYLPMSHLDWPEVLREAGYQEALAPIVPHPFS